MGAVDLKNRWLATLVAAMLVATLDVAVALGHLVGGPKL